MKTSAVILLAALAATTALGGASPESFAELVKIIRPQREAELLAQKFDTQLQMAFASALDGQATPEGEAYAEALRQKVHENFEREISPDRLARAYLDSAGRHWQQEEVDALLELAKNPAGRKALAKLAGTSVAVGAIARQSFVRFQREPAQSVESAVKELTEVNHKALAARSAVAVPAAPADAPKPPPAK